MLVHTPPQAALTRFYLFQLRLARACLPHFPSLIVKNNWKCIIQTVYFSCRRNRNNKIDQQKPLKVRTALGSVTPTEMTTTVTLSRSVTGSVTEAATTNVTEIAREIVDHQKDEKDLSTIITMIMKKWVPDYIFMTVDLSRIEKMSATQFYCAVPQHVVILVDSWPCDVTCPVLQSIKKALIVETQTPIFLFSVSRKIFFLCTYFLYTFFFHLYQMCIWDRYYWKH